LYLAIFDLDNTLLRGDSDYLWGTFLIDNGYVDADYHRRENDRFYREYEQGTMDIMAFLRFQLAPLTRFTLPELHAMREEYLRTCIAPIVTPAARDLVEQHRARGACLLVVTATNSFITRPIVDMFGIDNLIATEPELINGRYSGRVSGTPSYREGKIERLRQWLAERDQSMQGSWFYSDSHNDLPLLEMVDNPVAVNPDGQLRQRATQCGWPIILLD
jgi:HAD superfamily hydrolase (TIGR01490 family)